MGELPQDALYRLLRDDLAPFRDFVQFESVAVSKTELKDSPKYGIPTRYVRTVHEASMAESAYRPEQTSTVSLNSRGIGHFGDAQPPLLDVFTIHDGKHDKLYTWLHPERYERLKAGDNDES